MTVDLDRIGRQAEITLRGTMLLTDVRALVSEVRRLTEENQQLRADPSRWYLIHMRQCPTARVDEICRCQP